MNYFINTSLFFLLTSQLLNATEVKIKTKKFEDKFCKNFKLDGLKNRFCMTNIVNYPLVESRNKILEKHLKKIIEEKSGTLEKGESEKYVLKVIKDNESTNIGHQNIITLKLLAVTPKTFTIEKSGYIYFGGMEGSYVTTLTNYNSVTGKKLTVDELFIENYRKELTKIAEKAYRTQEHISPTDSLVDKLNWSENKFVLAKNIGIGKDGLHLEYNPYEVIDRSRPSKKLIIRYDLLKELIPKDGYLSSFVEESKLLVNHSKIYSFFDKLLQLNLDVKRIAKDKIELTLIAKNRSYSISKGVVSLSFPQLKNKIEVIKRTPQDFTKLLVYPKNSSIYNFKSKKSQKSDYLLVEGEAKTWEDNEQKSMKIVLKIPKEIETFDINLRATFIKEKKILNSPFDGIEGQQGVVNHIIKVSL